MALTSAFNPLSPDNSPSPSVDSSGHQKKLLTPRPLSPLSSEKHTRASGRLSASTARNRNKARSNLQRALDDEVAGRKTRRNKKTLMPSLKKTTTESLLSPRHARAKSQHFISTGRRVLYDDESQGSDGSKDIVMFTLRVQSNPLQK